MLSLLTVLCGTLCFWTAPASSENEPQAAPSAATSTIPYQDAIGSRPILQLDHGVLLAPVERYTGRETSPSPWWNPAYFRRSAPEMVALEQAWRSPLLAAYHQFVASGGENGIAITYQIDGKPACLLENEVLNLLDHLVTHPASSANHMRIFIAWHEYGHCVYHAMRTRGGSPATTPSMDSQERYRIELFADAYALTQMWAHHNLDAAEMIMQRREIGLKLNGDITHWTVPGLVSWREFLAQGGEEPIETLYSWVTGHDWVAIRDAELAHR